MVSEIEGLRYELTKATLFVIALQARLHELRDAERDAQRWREFATHLEGGGVGTREQFGIETEVPS